MCDTDLVEALLHNPVTARVRDVLVEPEGAGGIDPAVGAVHRTVGVPVLLLKLAARGLEPVEPVRALVCLDVILQARVRDQAGGDLHRHDGLGRGGGRDEGQGSLLASSVKKGHLH